MRVYTKIVGHWDYERQQYVMDEPLSEWHEHEGEVSECKKGRETVEKAGDQSLADARKASGYANQNQAWRVAAKAKGDTLADSFTPDANGGLSTYAKAQYGAATRNNANEADALRKQGFATLNRRGFGSVPIGAGSSLINSVNEAQSKADTDAYSNAQASTLGQGLEALKYYTGQQDLYDPAREIAAASQANSTAADAGFKRSQMGSTFGDVMGGIGSIGKMAGGFMTGGLGGLAGLFPR